MYQRLINIVPSVINERPKALSHQFTRNFLQISETRGRCLSTFAINPARNGRTLIFKSTSLHLLLFLIERAMHSKKTVDETACHAPAPIERSRVDQEHIIQSSNWDEEQSQQQEQTNKLKQGGVLLPNERTYGRPTILSCKAQNCPAHQTDKK